MTKTTFSKSGRVADIMKKHFLWNLPKETMPREVRLRVMEAIAEAYNMGAVHQYQHDVKTMDTIRKEKVK